MNGLLVLAIVVGMSVKDISETAIANLEYESARHTGPTFAGDTLYSETTVLEVIARRRARTIAASFTSRRAASIRRMRLS